MEARGGKINVSSDPSKEIAGVRLSLLPTASCFPNSTRTDLIILDPPKQEIQISAVDQRRAN